jgi:hypothetical protein
MSDYSSGLDQDFSRLHASTYIYWFQQNQSWQMQHLHPGQCSATVHADWPSYKNMTAAMKTYFH